tara:strand:- start:2066 stop:2302 length:237 start_codon:yes stop_codon:yes gene_type:complete
MQNQEIIKIIENLKGRKDYEQKKATKLGFNTLYEYFEDKIIKEKKALEDDKQKLKEMKVCNEIINEDRNKKKKSCSCC